MWKEIKYACCKEFMNNKRKEIRRKGTGMIVVTEYENKICNGGGGGTN
jgi:hypothetical protein